MARVAGARNPIVNEIKIGGVWTDVTPATLRDNGNGIRIKRGYASETTTAVGTANMIFSNYGQYNDFFSWRKPTSVNYNKLGINTETRQRMRWFNCKFGTNVANTWPAPESGQPWTLAGGLASDFSSMNGKGIIKIRGTVVNTFLTASAPINGPAYELSWSVSFDTLPTGANIIARGALGVDPNNFYGVEVTYVVATGNVTFTPIKLVAGTRTALGSATTIGTAPMMNVQCNVRMRLFADGRMWVDANTDDLYSRAPQWKRFTDPAGTLQAASQSVFFRTRTETGNTNGDMNVTFSNIEVNDWRFWGSIPSWAPNRDSTQTYKYVPVTAGDLIRQISTGNKPLASAAYSQISGAAPSVIAPVAYYPMEEGTDARQFANVMTPFNTLKSNGTVQLGAAPGPVGSLNLAYFPTGSNAQAGIPLYTGTTVMGITGAMKLNASPGATITLAEIKCTGALIGRITVVWDNPTSSIVTNVYSTNTTSLIATNSQPTNNLGTQTFFGNWWTWGLYITPNVGAPTNLDVISMFGNSQTMTTITSFLGSGGVPPGVATSLRLIGNDNFSTGHWAVYANPAFTTDNIKDIAKAIDGWRGELATTRMTRLMAENGFSTRLQIIGTLSASAKMGPQLPDTLIANLNDCAQVDGGLLFGASDFYGITYRMLNSLYNQFSGAPVIDYSLDYLSTFNINDDERLLINDSNVRRAGGSSARVVDSTSRLGTGVVGTYRDPVLSWNIGTDDQAYPLAGWRVHRGTFDVARVTQAGVNLSRLQFTDDDVITANICRMDIGDYWLMTTPPSDQAPDAMEFINIGTQELMANVEWTIDFTPVPGGAFTVSVLDNTVYGRVDGNHALYTNYTTGDTALTIATLSGPTMTDTPTGQKWKVAGEVMTVNAITLPTVTFGAAGSINVATSSTSALAALAPAGGSAGDMHLIFASCRNSGTGIPDTPAGWTRLPAFFFASNAQIFARVWNGTDPWPNITFAGGATNETALVQTCRISGPFYSVASAFVLGGNSFTSVAAQNILYPGISKVALYDRCMIFYAGWKQTSLTSVATLAGATAIQTASSVNGNQAAQVWQYVNQTNRAVIPSGSFAVTGGVAALSRGAVFAIRCDTQPVTVTRSVNGVVKNQVAGEKVALFPAPYVGR